MNRARLSLLVVFGISLLFAVGCRPNWPECKSDKHCRLDADKNEVNYICVDGACRECVSDQDCASGFECQDYACVPEPECRSDRDCPGNLICRNQECVPECTTNAECADGMKCEANRCVPDVECVTNSDCKEGFECRRGECVERVDAVSCDFHTVNFVYDSSALSAEARRILANNAECVRQMSGTITLEGHADERGTQEYNLALGERRANSVRRYLIDLGVSSDRLRTVSYGKERPVDRRSNEEAWARNRRVEFNAPNSRR